MGPGNYGFVPAHFLSIYWPHYSLFIRKNDINIDKNKYNFLGSFLNYLKDAFLDVRPLKTGSSPFV